MGVGRGRFYEDLIALGFSGLCLDLNRELIVDHEAQRRFPPDRVQFSSANFFSLDAKFDLVVAFEVLEHYDQDVFCLRKWRSLLEHQGILLFSVPAHMRQWTENDTEAGHSRRYEKRELLEKVKQGGFQVEHLWCYGFPLLNVTYRVSSRCCRPAPNRHSHSKQDLDPLMTDFGRTSCSGDRHLPLSRWVLHEPFWLPWLHMQRAFLEGDLGTGYILRCSLA
jgi:SAM-dependent methyltransferase